MPALRTTGLLGSLFGALLLLSASGLVSTGRAQDRALDPESTLNGILERGKLRVCFEAGYMPFEMVGTRSGLRERSFRPADERKGGQTTDFGGFDIDIGRAMARELGVDFAPINTRWTSVIPSLNLGRCDIIISGMSVTEARSEKVDFSDPYMRIGQTVLLRRGLESAVTSYRDLNSADYTVATKPGTTSEAAIKRLVPDAKVKAFNLEQEAADAVRAGEVDAFVYDFPYNATYVAMHGESDVVFLDEPFTDEPIAFAIRKDDPEFLNWLNGFLAKLKADGRLDAIHGKWFGSNAWFDRYR